MRTPHLLTLLLSLSIFNYSKGGEAEAITAAIIHSAGTGVKTYRYVWLQTGVDPRVVDLAVNLAFPTNDVSDLIRGELVDADVLAYNLADFDPKEPERLIKLWDSLATEDPIFHVSEQLQIEVPAEPEEPAEGEEAPPVEPIVTKQSIPILSPHLSDAVAEDITNRNDKRLDVILTELSSSPAPILEARFLLEQILDLKYYSFRNLKAGDPIADPLARAGYFIGTNKEQYTLKTNYLIRSMITGNQRVVVAAYGTAGPTPATITYDQFDETVRPEVQFVRNLDTFTTVYDGNEIFIPMANGLIEFLLADSEGKLVAAAPPNLAIDSTKPQGHDTILRPAVSCLACHIRDGGTGMYRSFENDYEKLPLAGLDPLKSVILRKLYGRKLDEQDGVLGRARRDFIFAISPLAPAVEGAEENPENMLIKDLVSVIRNYRYDMVTAEMMASELGLPDNVALDKAINLTDDEVIDPEVYLAVKGVPLSRSSWNVIRLELASRLASNPLGQNHGQIENPEPVVVDDPVSDDVDDDGTTPEMQQP